MNKIYALIERYPLRFALAWLTWHWGLLLFGLLHYPEPRLTVMKLALGIDALCFISFFMWMLHWIRTGPLPHEH